MSEHYTRESEGRIGSVRSVEDAHKAHHLATADPEVDGLLTGAEHEAKYGLERAPKPEKVETVETASVKPADETAAAERPSK